ncbi:MAG: hypothetical protein FWD34_06740 [Oscillospiraceae bacterium]|nr:hypothetical protein [Oscillospiraceae bacterium]
MDFKPGNGTKGEIESIAAEYIKEALLMAKKAGHLPNDNTAAKPKTPPPNKSEKELSIDDFPFDEIIFEEEEELEEDVDIALITQENQQTGTEQKTPSFDDYISRRNRSWEKKPSGTNNSKAEMKPEKPQPEPEPEPEIEEEKAETLEKPEKPEKPEIPENPEKPENKSGETNKTGNSSKPKPKSEMKPEKEKISEKPEKSETKPEKEKSMEKPEKEISSQDGDCKE